MRIRKGVLGGLMAMAYSWMADGGWETGEDGGYRG